jgi:Mrp family chromosome partitioning ATPase
MGKVYEALSRARNQVDESDFLEYTEEPRENPIEQAGKFSFLQYSLGKTSVLVNERANGSTALVSQSRFQPGREIIIKPEGVDPGLVAFYSLERQALQEYNKLALSLISATARRGSKRVLVASAVKGEGRTCVALNLAWALARARQRVLVVDCDLLNPSVMRALGVNCEVGMYEAFQQGLPLAAAAVAIRPYGFNVLPTKRPVDNPAELLAAPGFWSVLQTLDADHDFILLDSSPLVDGSDSNMLARFTNATLLVIRAGHTRSAQLGKAMSPFAQKDIIGVVINRARN